MTPPTHDGASERERLIDEAEAGRAAYEAFVKGWTMPPWEDVSKERRRRWTEAAIAAWRALQRKGGSP